MTQSPGQQYQHQEQQLIILARWEFENAEAIDVAEKAEQVISRHRPTRFYADQQPTTQKRNLLTEDELERLRNERNAYEYA